MPGGTLPRMTAGSTCFGNWVRLEYTRCPTRKLVSGAAAGALGKQRAQEVNSSTEPGATANVTERYQPVDSLPERG